MSKGDGVHESRNQTECSRNIMKDHQENPRHCSLRKRILEGSLIPIPCWGCPPDLLNFPERGECDYRVFLVP